MRRRGRFPSRGRMAPAGANRSRCSPSGNEHSDLASITQVAVAELRDEVALLKPDTDEDVAGAADREEQMACCHDRRRPETEQKPEIDRVPHEAVEEWRSEFGLRQLTSVQIRNHLFHTEELEVVDEEAAREQHPPSEPEHHPEE